MSLLRRADRRTQFLAQVPSAIAVVPSYAIGGDLDHLEWNNALLSQFTLFPWKIAHHNSWWSRNIKRGEIACAMNHLACWREANRAGASAAVIFEDDAILRPRLFQDLPKLLDKLSRADPAWDLLYLGRERIGRDTEFQHPFVWPGFSYCSYGYVVSKSGLRTLLEYELDSKLMPLDEFLVATYMEHPREDVRRSILPMIRAYGLVEDWVTEADDRVLGSDTESSLDGHL